LDKAGYQLQKATEKLPYVGRVNCWVVGSGLMTRPPDV